MESLMKVEISLNIFFFYIQCETVEYSSRLYDSTTKLLRHKCATSLSINQIKVNINDIEKIERAAAMFVCIDLRPFNAIECTGLRELILAAIRKGISLIENRKFFTNFSIEKIC